MSGEVNAQLRESDFYEARPVTTSGVAYAAGDLIGNDLVSFTDYDNRKALSGHIKTVIAVDMDKNASDLHLVFLGQSTADTVFTNNSAVGITTRDAAQTLGVAELTKHYQLGSASVSVWDGDITLRLRSGIALYGVPIAKGAPTYSGVSQLLIRLGIAQD